MDTAARGWIGQLIFPPPFEPGEHIGPPDGIGVETAFGIAESSAQPPEPARHTERLRCDEVFGLRASGKLL